MIVVHAHPLIVVVDDDLSIITLLRALVSEDDFEQLCCLSTSEAYPFIKRELPDLIVLAKDDGDLGAQVLGLIRCDPATEEIPIIIWSTNKAPAVAEEIASVVHQTLSRFK